MVRKVEVPPNCYIKETIDLLGKHGLLLVSGDKERANVMTIGWGLPGRLWGKPFFMVAVRLSRYTHRFIEEVGDFTVNVPGRDMEDVVAYCGAVSGRDHNKFKEKGLTILPSKQVNSPVIAECIIHYECKVAYKIQVAQEDLPKDLISMWYPNRDFHTLYFGEIVATYADEDAKEKL